MVILTTEAYKNIETIHSRMPLIIPAECNDAWLSGNMSKEDALLACRKIELVTHTVSSRVNKMIHNDNSLIEQKDPIKDDQLRLF